METAPPTVVVGTVYIGTCEDYWVLVNRPGG